MRPSRLGGRLSFSPGRSDLHTVAVSHRVGAQGVGTPAPDQAVTPLLVPTAPDRRARPFPVGPPVPEVLQLILTACRARQSEQLVSLCVRR